MKAKIAIVTLVGLTACNLAWSQETSADKPPTTPAVSAATPSKIPLIEFREVLLTTAIDNLARQAGINYILDPKVGFGQPDERGQVKPQPNITIRWENLTAEQALNALIGTYGLQLVTDNKTGISRVTVKDPAAAEPLVTKVVQLKFASPSNMVASVMTVLGDKRSKVIADVRTSQLVVSATEKEQEAVEKLVERLDTQTKQVLIEAKIMETTLNPKSSKGIDWSGTLSNQKIQFGNGKTTGNITRTKGDISGGTIVGNSAGSTVGPTLVTGFPNPSYSEQLNSAIGGIVPGLGFSTAGGMSPSTAFLNADGLSVALAFLNESGDTKVVSEPRMVTLDNQKATIDVGLMYPVVNVSAGTANTAGGSQISYTNLTVNLDVTPRIAANNFIELKVTQGVLRLGPTFSSTVADQVNVVDSFLTRKLDTTVLIPSGNTLVMGGLIQDEKRNGSTKVPILGDIPWIGLLFRKESKALDRQNLTIFITPTVVQDSDFQPTKTDYLKTTGEEQVKEDWTAWDSGKPLDWSKFSSGGTKD
jgi:type IV pilus assembly protein PilQ